MSQVLFIIDLLEDAVQEELVALCLDPPAWKTRLGGVDVWAQSHCDTMLTYLRVD